MARPEAKDASIIGLRNVLLRQEEDKSPTEYVIFPKQNEFWMQIERGKARSQLEVFIADRLKEGFDGIEWMVSPSNYGIQQNETQSTVAEFTAKPKVERVNLTKDQLDNPMTAGTLAMQLQNVFVAKFTKNPTETETQ